MLLLFKLQRSSSIQVEPCSFDKPYRAYNDKFQNCISGSISFFRTVCIYERETAREVRNANAIEKPTLY